MTNHLIERFAIADAQIDKVLQVALSKGGHFAELYFQDSSSQGVSLEDRLVNRVGSSTDFGVGIRVVVGDKVGYAFTEQVDLKRLVDTAKVAATIAQSDVLRHVMPFRMETSACWYPAVEKHANLDVLVGLLKRLEAQIFDFDKRVTKVQLSVNTQHAYVAVVNNIGTCAEDFQPMVVLSASVVVEHGGRKEQNRHNIAARAGFDWLTDARLADFVAKTVDGATVLLGAIQPEGGEMEVVLGPGGSGILLHEAIGHGLEADFNRKGLSIFSEKIGKRIASPEITIVDDGTIPGLRGSIHFDDEGVPGQRTVLVDKGILTSYIHDRISADYYGLPPTGNGRRQSFRDQPMPRMRNTIMMGGPHDPSAIIASVKKGIYADQFANGQVNIGAGDFTFYVKSGFQIENGKLTQPIKDVNIIG
ncbi:MAG: Metalloprotease TldD, partial [Bacteroidota bacterium]